MTPNKLTQSLTRVRIKTYPCPCQLKFSQGNQITIHQILVAQLLHRVPLGADHRQGEMNLTIIQLTPIQPSLTLLTTRLEDLWQRRARLQPAPAP